MEKAVDGRDDDDEGEDDNCQNPPKKGTDESTFTFH
jgi:hypothetical protein